MSDNIQPNPHPEEAPENLVAEPESKESTEATAPSPEEESTIGTGTSMALGCIAGTAVLIVFGLLFLFLSQFI